MRRTLLLALLSLSSIPLGPSSFPQEAPPPRRKAPPTDRAHLGIQPLPVHPGEEPPGLKVNYVFPDSAAEAMGFRVGDEVLELDGAAVPDSKFFITALQKKGIGEAVRFRVKRGESALDLHGEMRSYLKTRQAFIDRCRTDLVGKPFQSEAEIVWLDPWKKTTLAGLRGKVAVLVFFDNCSECVVPKWKKIRDMHQTLHRAKLDGWLSFAGIYTNVARPHEENEAQLRNIHDHYPGQFPIAVARYAGGKIPPGSMGRDPLVQGHGAALLDPDGNLFYLELESPGEEFLAAFKRAQARFAPKEPTPEAKPAEKPVPK